jgi:glutathione reductase (NADPH)
MRHNGIAIYPQSEFVRVSQTQGKPVLHLKDQDHPFDALLNATGRKPNTAGLGLEALGIELGTDGAIPVDAMSRTSCPGIFAVGDVTNRKNLTPVAIAEGRAFAENEFRGASITVDHDSVATATFTHPPLGSVGLTEQAAMVNRRLRIYETEFRPMRTAFAGGQQKAYMKLIVDDASDQVLGIHMLGEDAPEIIQSLAVAYRMGATKADFDRTVAVHPTIAEEFMLLRELSRTVGHSKP